MTRVLPACLILYWGALFASRGSDGVMQWWQTGSSPFAGFLAVADLALGLVVIAGALCILLPDASAGGRARTLYGPVALAAVALSAMDGSLSAAALPVLILSLMTLRPLFGSSAEGRPRAANDNGGLRETIDVMVRLVNLPSGREAGR